MAESFWNVKTIVRAADGTERAFEVEVDPECPLDALAADLIAALPIGGGVHDYDLRKEGSIGQPVLVLTAKGRR